MRAPPSSERAPPVTGAPTDPSIGAADPAYAKAIALGQSELQAVISTLDASMVSIARVTSDAIGCSQAMGTVAGPGTTAGVSVPAGGYVILLGILGTTVTANVC